MRGNIVQPRPETQGTRYATSPLAPDWGQCQADTTVARLRYRGHVEYVVSRQAAPIVSLEELPALLGQGLATVRAPPRFTSNLHVASGEIFMNGLPRKGQ